jgi:hypothetical protein
MNLVLIMQIILMIAIFSGGLQCGMTLSQMFRAKATWLKLVPPVFASIAMTGLLVLSIIHPERFGLG